MRAITQFFSEYANIFTDFIEDIIKFDENSEIFIKFFRFTSKNIEIFITNNFSSFYLAWLTTYDVYPEWTIAITGLTILLGPYVLWVTTNILILIIIFIWYFTIYICNYITDNNLDLKPKVYILKFITQIGYFLEILNIFKFNYYNMINFIYYISEYFNYSKKNLKYKYDVYGNSLIMINKSFFNIFKKILYINFNFDSFYYQYRLALHERSLEYFHSDYDNEDFDDDPEDFEQVTLWGLLRFKYKLYLLQIFKSINKYTIFDRFSKRRRFSFFYKIKKSFIVYCLYNFKNLIISLILISFFNIILFKFLIIFLKYITNL